MENILLWVNIIKTYIVHIILALVVCMKLTLKNEINEVQLKIDENIKGIYSGFMI